METQEFIQGRKAIWQPSKLSLWLVPINLYVQWALAKQETLQLITTNWSDNALKLTMQAPLGGFTIEPLPMVQRKCSSRMEASLAHSHHWHPHSPGIHHTLSNRILGFHPHLFSNCYNPMFFPILNFTRLHLFPISNHLYTAWETIKEISRWDVTDLDTSLSSQSHSPIHMIPWLPHIHIEHRCKCLTLEGKSVSDVSLASLLQSFSA